MVRGALDPQRPALHMAASSARGDAAKKRKEVIQMSKIKGYIEYEDKRFDFDGSNAVAFVAIDGETATGGIVGKPTGIIEHAYMAHMISTVANELTNRSESTLKKIIEKEEPQ